MLLTRLLSRSLCAPSSRRSPWTDLQLGPWLTPTGIIIITITAITLTINIIISPSPLSICLSVSLSLSLSPKQSSRGPHTMSLGSARRFCLFTNHKRQFFVATVAKCLLMWLLGLFRIKSQSRPALFVKCLDMTVVMIWRYINKVELN